MIEYLRLEDVLEIVAALSAQVRDPGLLASAVARSQMTVFGKDAYPDLTTKAAALMSSLVRNHALVDGNKRLCWIALRLFLRLNDNDIVYPIDDAEHLVLAAAQGHLDVNELAASLREHLLDPLARSNPGRVGGTVTRPIDLPHYQEQDQSEAHRTIPGRVRDPG